MSWLRRRGAWILVLTAIWVLLNGEPSVGNIIGGVLVAVLVLVAFPLAPTPGATSHRFHPWAALSYVGFVLWNLLTSSVQVVVAVLAPTPARLRAGIVRVELPGATPLVVTLVANAITLTPGTLTVTAESDPATLHVHVLGLGDVEEFRAGVADLHARATAAFTPTPAEAAR
ncbi:Na+/H+ antiporter subunit E [Iamia majanohamensis]|uniref:Na+/H+ antiporter subunit E n=1 Tax=Iamia majanohamensis TaxID=467976 RepID=A0AAE9Y615_9ACTN|nr:Na+/H+ antiporter subunit E [Iamia majanohamensis]WCO67275.1 Na+/H+ antiporter subunit E [Iamia majanohamensis]